MTISSEYLDQLTPSAIRSITAKIRDKAKAGVAIASFAGGLPAAEFFPTTEIREITNKVLAEEGGNAIQYAASDGYDPLRETLVDLMKKFDVRNIDYKNILITSGAQQGLNYIMKGLIQKGNVVVCENPTYVGALDTMRACNPKIIGVNMDDDGMNMEELEGILKKIKVSVIYTIPDFQNPTGRCMSIAKRKKLVQLAEKYNTIIFEDAPYSMLTFNGKLMPAIKSFDEHDHVIYSGSTSKTIAPGIRIGWLVADKDSIQKLTYMKMRDDLQVNNLAQRQVYHYIADYDFDGHLAQVCQVYKKRRDCMLETVKANFPSDSKITVPEGGLFMWIELNKEVNTLEMFDFVFQKNIAYVPGTFFCPDRSGLNTMRLNFATADETIIREGIAELGRIIKEYKK